MNMDIVTVDNYIGGKFVAPSTEKYLDVVNPANSHAIGKVGISNSNDVDDAVAAADAAFPAWAALTVKARAAIVSFFLICLLSPNPNRLKPPSLDRFVL